MIKDLGPFRFPKPYQRHLDHIRAAFRSTQGSEQDALKWDQYIIQESLWDSYNGDVPVLFSDKSFKMAMAKLFKGDQIVVSMALVSCEDHVDDYDYMIDTCVIVVRDCSPLHYLVVDGCKPKQLKKNHMYSFNQKRNHRLMYGNPGPDGETDDYPITERSKPCTLISVGFRRSSRTPQ